MFLTALPISLASQIRPHLLRARMPYVVYLRRSVYGISDDRASRQYPPRLYSSSSTAAAPAGQTAMMELCANLNQSSMAGYGQLLAIAYLFPNDILTYFLTYCLTPPLLLPNLTWLPE